MDAVRERLGIAAIHSKEYGRKRDRTWYGTFTNTCNDIMSDYSIVVNHRYLGCNVLSVVANDAPLWHLILRSRTILNILTD